MCVSARACVYVHIIYTLCMLGFGFGENGAQTLPPSLIDPSFSLRSEKAGDANDNDNDDDDDDDYDDLN